MVTHEAFEFVLDDDSRSFCGRYEEDVIEKMREEGVSLESGSWKWYGNLIGDRWRFNPNRNEVTRRIGQGKGHRVHTSEYSLKLNIEKAHEARRKNHELARSIASKAGKASWASLTEEQRHERAMKMVEGKRRKKQEKKND